VTGPGAPVAAARQAVLADVVDLSPGSLVLVGCSGGADSLALAAATAFVAPRAGLRAGAVVVDHGLLPGSELVAARAAEACRGLGLDPVRVVRVVVGRTGGPEAGARSARYAALEAVAHDEGAAVILLGHTLDDQAEQVLLGLARGSGARSLAGMPARRGVLRRPLLGLRRSDTEAVCAVLGLEPWHDPTNAVDPAERGVAPLRSRVRHQLLPVLEDVLGPGVAVALARTAAQLREDADALDGAAGALLAEALLEPAGIAGDAPGSGPRVRVDVLAGAPAAVRHRALRLALLEAGCPAGSLNREHVLGVDALLTSWHGQGPLDLPGRVSVRRTCGRLELRSGRAG
jgi:tRNA(Ile)-lysidine synthase